MGGHAALNFAGDSTSAKKPEDPEQEKDSGESNTKMVKESLSVVQRIEKEKEKPVEAEEEKGADDEIDEDCELLTQEDKLAELIKRMMASGYTAKAIKKKMEKESREEKAKAKTRAAGRGRGRGVVKGKNK